jgi:UDP-N-acetyl-D-mannosaminuronate dehydrogenase
VLYGLTYKKNVGDFRNSPSLSILNNLAQIPALNIEVSDPFFEVKKHAHLIPSSVSVIGEESDPKDNRLHVLLVAHDVFSHLNLTNYPDLAIINFCRKTV